MKTYIYLFVKESWKKYPSFQKQILSNWFQIESL